MSTKFRFDSLILWEDKDYIGINKPPFIATLKDRNEPVHLLALAKAYSPEAQACHRLDKHTSGVMVFAKNAAAYRHLSLQFQNREVVKLYHAVTEGIHHFDSTVVDEPILKQNDGRVKVSRSHGKPAETGVHTIETFRAHTLVECRPVTGRMHQIRVHLACLGAPITGDELYGGKPFYLSAVKKEFSLKRFTEEQPLIKRMALHAAQLSFKNLEGEVITLTAPYPKDIKALIRQLELNP